MEDINDFLKNKRIDYNLGILDITTADPDPFNQFAAWMKIAVDANVSEPNAMNLATVSDTGQPSSRIVLLRNFDQDGFVFFTNYESHKGRELEAHKKAAINFFWSELHKQVRIEGSVVRVPDWDSDDYFGSRPRESQIGALASQQSKELNSRDELEQNVKNLTNELNGKEIKRPVYWGGYRIIPHFFEFWQGRPSRLHDRIKYEKAGNEWRRCRLYP